MYCCSLVNHFHLHITGLLVQNLDQQISNLNYKIGHKTHNTMKTQRTAGTTLKSCYNNTFY